MYLRTAKYVIQTVMEIIETKHKIFVLISNLDIYIYKDYYMDLFSINVGFSCQ